MTQPRERPAYRRTDPETSRRAYESVQPRVGTTRSAVLALLLDEPAGLTGWEIAARLRRPHNNISPRIAELRHAGLVVDSNRRRPGPDGRATQVVWLATDLARGW